MAKKEFQDKFGIAKKMKIYDIIPKCDGHGNKVARQRAIVLPLKVQDGVIAVPFIVDTCARGSAYFGTKAVYLLKDLGVLRDVVGTIYPYVVNGSLCYEKKSIHFMYINCVPSPHIIRNAGSRL